MINRFHNSIGLPLVAALTIVMCGFARSEAAEAETQTGHTASKTKSASEAKSAAGQKMCAEHGLPETECGICHPEMAAKLKPGEGSKVRMPAVDSATLVGVEMAQATVGDISEGVECYAELAFNQNRLAQIAAPVGGVLQAVAVDLGTKVEEKQTLAKIWSAAIAEAVAKAVLSHQTLERERKLRAERVSSEKDLQQAEADHRAACQQLRTQGFTED
jgi:cobalt-zinc-cadmium efflux system membrane fusion protein